MVKKMRKERSVRKAATGVHKVSEVRFFKDGKYIISSIKLELSTEEVAQGPTRTEAAKRAAEICRMRLDETLDHLLRPYDADTMAPVRLDKVTTFKVKLSLDKCCGEKLYLCSCEKDHPEVASRLGKTKYGEFGLRDHLLSDHELTKSDVKSVIEAVKQFGKALFKNGRKQKIVACY